MKGKVKKEHDELSKSSLERISSGDAFAKLVGTELLELRPGFARACLKITEHIVNVHQMAHGAAIFTLADLVCEAAGNSFGEPAMALQTSIHYLVPGKYGDLLMATAKLTGRSESMGVIEFEVKNNEERLLSTGQQIVIFRKMKKQI
jgi:acyl-CoA thioesterase